MLTVAATSVWATIVDTAGEAARAMWQDFWPTRPESPAWVGKVLLRMESVDHRKIKKKTVAARRTLPKKFVFG